MGKGNKTNKRMSKTFRLTGTGKIMARRSGQAHFNARESGNTTKNKRRDFQLAHVNRRIKEVMGK